MEFNIQKNLPFHSNFMPTILCLVVLFLTNTIIWGWFTNNINLINFFSLGTPIHINTAVALAISALGTCCWIFNQKRLLPLLGLLLILFSSIVILHYLTPLNASLQNLLLQNEPTIKSFTHGIGIHTAICFLLFGLFFFSHLFRKNKNISFYQASFAITIIICSIAGFIDYWLDIKFVIHDNMIIYGGMPFALAGAIFTLGTILINNILRTKNSPYLLLAFLIPFGLISSIQAYLFLSFFDTNTIKERFNNHASIYLSDIQSIFNTNKNEIIALKSLYVSSESVSEKEFQQFLKNITTISSSEYFIWATYDDNKQKIVTVDDYHIRYTYPTEAETSPNYLYTKTSLIQTILKNNAINDKNPSVLYNNGRNNIPHFSFVIGIAHQQKNIPYLKGVLIKHITADQLINQSLKLNPIGNQDIIFFVYGLDDTKQGQLIHSHPKDNLYKSKVPKTIMLDNFQPPGIHYLQKFMLGNRNFIFLAIPSETYIKEQRSPIPLMTFLGILIFAALITYFTYRTLSIRSEIEKEVDEKTKDLAIHQARLKEAQKLANVGSWRYFVKDELLILNENLLEMLSLSTNESTTNLDNFATKLHEEDSDRLKKDLKTCLEQGNYFETEIRYIFDDNSCRFYSFRGDPKFNIQGNIEEIVGSVIDITEHKFIEQKLNEIVKAKSQFTSMVSHELRTPLFAIQESINLILDGVGGEPTEEHRKFLTLSLNNLKRLNNMVNNVLDFYKTESGAMDMHIEPHDINETIKGVVEFMKPVANKKGLTLTYCAEQQPKNISFDKNKIIQVTTNLLNNAFKFTDQGSVTVTLKEHDENIEVLVKDTGPGIPSDQYEAIFDSYKQIGDINKQKQGTGLGLTISQKIIEAHQGKIWVKSKIGQGTTFYFTLPKKR